jgi:hypothetical protein
VSLFLIEQEHGCCGWGKWRIMAKGHVFTTAPMSTIQSAILYYILRIFNKGREHLGGLGNGRKRGG